jgi:hypothetical protein
MTALPLKGNPFKANDAVTACDALTAALAVPMKFNAVTDPDVTIILPEGTIRPFLAINSFAIIPLLHISKGKYQLL